MSNIFRGYICWLISTKPKVIILNFFSLSTLLLNVIHFTEILEIQIIPIKVPWSFFNFRLIYAYKFTKIRIIILSQPII